MKKLFLLLLLLYQVTPAQAQDCTPRDFERLMADAKRLAKAGEYDKAINKLQSAKTCQPQREAEVSAEILRVFEQVNRERKRAEEQTKIATAEKERAEAEGRRIYANDLAYKSQVALKAGDRTTAFNLAEIAQQFVDHNNPNVARALHEALYYNDNPEQPPLPWVASLLEGADYVENSAFLPDGRHLASCTGTFSSSDYSIKIWDLISGKVSQVLEGHTDYAQCVAVAADGSSLVSGSTDGTAILWDMPAGEKRLVLTGDSSPITSVAISHDGKMVAAGTFDGMFFIWDGKTGAQKIALESGLLNSIVFSPDGKYLAVASYNFMGILESTTGTLLQEYEGSGGSIQQLAYAPNGKYLAIGAYDSTAVLYAIDSCQIVQRFKGHNGYINWINFSADGKSIITGAQDNTIKIWNPEDGQCQLTIDVSGPKLTCMAVSHVKPQIVSWSTDRNAKIWDLDISGASLTLQDTTYVNAVAFSRDGQHLAVGLDNNTAKILDTKRPQASTTQLEHQAPVYCLNYAPDGRYLATGTGKMLWRRNEINIWDTNTGKSIQKLSDRGSTISSLVFSPDGKLLATASGTSVDNDPTALIWDLATGKILHTLEGGNVSGLAFSPDGKLLVTGHSFGNLKIWEVATGKNIRELEGHLSNVSCVAFSPDGKQIASGSYDRTAKVWDLRTGKIMFTIVGHRQDIRCIAFSPDGKFLATGSVDNSVKIWDLKTALNAYTIQGHSNTINSLAFSNDGKYLATGSQSTTAKIWNLIPDSTIAIAHQHQLAYLTASQLQTYNLTGCMDILPGNESKFIATKSSWQIAAFADLYTQKIAQTGFPQKADYERAQRLYRACLSHNVDNAYFQQKIDDLERLWKDKNN